MIDAPAAPCRLQSLVLDRGPGPHLQQALGAGQGKVRHLGASLIIWVAAGVIHCPTQPQHMAWPRAGSYPQIPTSVAC